MLKTITRAASIAAALSLFAGCGGSNNTSSAGSGSASGGNTGGTNGGFTGGTQSEPIRGIATPSSVAVVTATNAN